VLAKCSRCSQTFQTDRYGEQFCPFCGAQVMIAAPAGAAPPPGATATPGAMPPPAASGAALPQDQEAPIDNPAAHGGWFNAALATWKQSLFEPNKFFERLKPGPDTGGALGYGVALLLVGGIFGGLMQFLQNLLQKSQMDQVMSQMSELPAETRHMVASLLGMMASPALIVALPILTVVSFFINAGLMHLALMIVGGNKNGFSATLRALCFASGPAIFNAVPFCGGMAAGIWTLILNVMGLSGLHRVSIGRVIGAYAVLIFGSCCLCLVPLGAAIGALASNMH